MASKCPSFYFRALIPNPTFNDERKTGPRWGVETALGIGGLWKGVCASLSRLIGLFSTTYSTVLFVIVTFCAGLGCLAVSEVLLLFPPLCVLALGLSRLRWFRIVFLVSRLMLGLIACGGFVLVFSYSCAKYSDDF